MDAQGRSRTPCPRRCTQVGADGAETSTLVGTLSRATASHRGGGLGNTATAIETAPVKFAKLSLSGGVRRREGPVVKGDV